jgi:hypothetical protein
MATVATAGTGGKTEAVTFELMAVASREGRTRATVATVGETAVVTADVAATGATSGAETVENAEAVLEVV